VYNPKFIPVNKNEAKDQIYRTVTHDHEVGAFIGKDLRAGT